VLLREAATVMLVRDDPALQVFMLRRNLESVWVAGAFVFPGGAVDPDDRSDVLAARCLDRTDASASRLLGLSDGGLGYWVAAVRETLEEAGVLLARSRSTGHLVDPTLVAPMRDALNSGKRSFTDLVVTHDLVLDTGALHPLSHWITPEGSPRRYDTRFFIAAAPEGHAYTPDESETVASRWARPADALDAADRGEIDLIFPTRKNLEVLADFTSAGGLLRAVSEAEASDRPPMRVSEHGGGTRVMLPGDVDDTEGAA
jgi:8-oxo-dGTP pyrophosphatase MutT (NUDIX family)